MTDLLLVKFDLSRTAVMDISDSKLFSPGLVCKFKC